MRWCRAHRADSVKPTSTQAPLPLLLDDLRHRAPVRSGVLIPSPSITELADDSVQQGRRLVHAERGLAQPVENEGITFDMMLSIEVVSVCDVLDVDRA